jgi:hypothetical protein
MQTEKDLRSATPIQLCRDAVPTLPDTADAMSSHPYPETGPTRYLFGAGPMEAPDCQVFS